MSETAITNTLENTVAEFINRTMMGIDSFTNFAEAQLPEYIQQLLAWNAWYNICIFGVGVLVLSALVFVDRKMWIYVDKEEKGDWDEDAIIVYWGIGTILRVMVYGFVAAVFFNLEWLKIWIAPKVWLVEYASNLIK